MRFRFRSILAAIAPVVIASVPLAAQTDVTPNLAATVPGSFYTDRYTPPVFTLSNGVFGRNNVLGVGVNSTSDLANRPAAYQSTFYNTQGEKTDVNTAGSWSFTSDLYVSSSWANTTANNGYVRSDMWATATSDGSFAIPSAYPIIGFTNFGGYTGFRGYDVISGNWDNFTSNAVNYGAWNTLEMSFNSGTDLFSYYVNGILAGTVGGTDGSTGVANVMYQAYNFNDPSVDAALNNPAFTADWSNTPGGNVVPEPGTMSLVATGLVGMAGASIRRRKKLV